MAVCLDLTGRKPRMFYRYQKRETVKIGFEYVENARQMFYAGMGNRTKKKVTTHVNHNGSVQTAIVTKRFHNSRLTCVCKSKIY